MTLAAGLLAAATVVVLHRRRRRNPEEPAFTVPEGPLLSAAQRDGIEASMDRIGPRAICAVAAWTKHTGTVPQILGAWEGEGATDFLLAADPSSLPSGQERLPPAQEWGRVHELCPPFTVPAHVQFSAYDHGVRARVAGGEVALLQPTGLALADGILAPVGRASAGALWLPLLGSPLAIWGPQASRLVSSMILATGLRVDGRELRIIVIGDVDELMLEGSPHLAEADLPAVERIPREAEAATRGWLEGELVRRARVFHTLGVDEIRTSALEHPDERFPALLVITDDRVVSEWGPLLDDAARFGIATLVLGEAATRTLEVAEGRCRVHDEQLGTLPELEACLLPESIASELVPTTPEPSPEPGEPPPPVPASAPVSVVLLGGFRAERYGEEINEWCRGRAKEVIAFLAGRGGATNAEMLDAFWGREAADAYHTKTLLNYISEARGWLRGMTPTRIIEKVDGRWQLVQDNVWVDVRAFEQAMREAEHASDPEPSLRRALELYGGDFCGGLAAHRVDPKNGNEGGLFSWATRETERLRCLFVTATARLAQILDDDGQPGNALEVIDRGLAEDPMCEALVRHAIRLAHGLEGPGAAAARFGDFERRLAVIGDEPSDETRQLLETSPAEAALKVARG